MIGYRHAQSPRAEPGYYSTSPTLTVCGRTVERWRTRSRKMSVVNCPDCRKALEALEVAKEIKAAFRSST